MFSSLALAILICFLAGIGIVVALGVRAGGGQDGGSIARVLYDVENPKKRR